MNKEFVQFVSSRRKQLVFSAGSAVAVIVIACGGSGKEVKTYNPNTGITIPPITPGPSRPVEASPAVVRPTVVSTPTIEAVKVELSADKGLAGMVQGKLKPQFASFDMTGAVEKVNNDKKSKTKTKEAGNLRVDPNQLNYSYEEGLDGKAFGWSFTVDQAALSGNTLDIAMGVLANFAKEVPEANTKWTTLRSGNQVAYEQVTQNPDGSFDSVVAIFVPGVNPGKWVVRTGFCHMTAADPKRTSNSCVGLQ